MKTMIEPGQITPQLGQISKFITALGLSSEVAGGESERIKVKGYGTIYFKDDRFVLRDDARVGPISEMRLRAELEQLATRLDE